MSLTLPSLRRLVLRTLSLATALTSLLPAPAQALGQTVDLPRVAVPTLAATAYANVVDAGPVPVSQSFSITLTLTPTAARAAALDSFLAALGASSSPSYHQWITPQQFAASYGATADQLAQVSLWAQAQGLVISSTSPAGTTGDADRFCRTRSKLPWVWRSTRTGTGRSNTSRM